MKNFKSHFKFNKQERSGIFFLLLGIILLQVGYFVFHFFPIDDGISNILAVDQQMQSEIDTLKQRAQQKDSVKIYPFNPNFITDYKGYVLGMSVDEIDRLHAFRSQNRYVNSIDDFQAITQVSDSLLRSIAPYFKFPDWVEKKGKRLTIDGKVKISNAIEKQKKIKDLNEATAQELKFISGIGDKLSARIIKFRDRLGGFLIDEQLYDVYGLEPQVVERALQKYRVIKKPEIQKIKLNSASVEELSKLIYIQKKVAIAIVNYRNVNKSIGSFDELTKIENFPKDKIERIKLYLIL